MTDFQILKFTSLTLESATEGLTVQNSITDLLIVSYRSQQIKQQ